ncbi:peptidoglycan DD-metalloendopeptidase family protein [Streptomyces sp. NPDC020141]|uniref:aggregation-promoting factor C-terminal-like domain-containing protein n=1 Tax=Streptomyces sp. NPDC020141 TaxID=3365065 RepID=UPI0037ACFBA5
MALDIVGTVAVDVVPIVPNFHNRLRDAVLPVADRVGQEAGAAMGQSMAAQMQSSFSGLGRGIGDAIGRDVGRALSRHLADAIPDAITAGAQRVRAAGSRQGDEVGGAFARSLRTRLQAAYRAMPRLDVRLTDTGVDAQLARLRARMETLSNKRIGIDVTAEAAAAEVAALEEQLLRLGSYHPNIAVRADTATARAALAEVRAEIAALTATPGTIRFETDGSFGERMRAVVAQAQASLPAVNISADSTAADVEVHRLRARLEALADQRVGIDIDATTALTTINAIRDRLNTLSDSDADIAVRVDAAAAASQLAALQAQVAALSRQRALIDVDTSGAQGALTSLIMQIGLLTAIPLGPALTAGFGALVAMITAAGAGVGALALAAVPAIKGVTEALAARKAAEEDTTRAATSSGAATSAAASRALRMAGAQQALATAHRTAARSIQQSEQAVTDAVRTSAEATRQAVQQVSTARRSLADAVEQAAERQRAAHARVTQAEQSVVAAQRASKAAQDDLTRARQDAVQGLMDLERQLTNSQLSERDAALSVQEAREQLHAVQERGIYATETERQRAQLVYDQAVQRLREQHSETRRLQSEKSAADRSSVKGSDAVRAAQDRVAESERAILDQQRDLREARRESAQQQIRSGRDIAEAQDRVAEATRSVSRVQEDGARSVQRAQESLVAAQESAADSIASAQRQIASAQRETVTATSQAATAQDRHREAVAKLTPAQRDLYDSIAGPAGLKSAFDVWQKSLQPEVLPLFTRGVEAATRALPSLTPLVLGAAAGMDTLWAKASRELKSPFWQSFKDDLSESVQPAVVGLGVAFGNVLKGIAGIIDAFLPHMDGIVDRSTRITESFARWGTSLKGSPDFERFLDYVKETSPGLVDFLRDILTAAYDVSKVMTTLSEILFDVLTPVLEAISWIAENAPGFIQLLWGIYFAQKAVALGMVAFAAAMAIYNAVIITATIITSGWAVALNATGIVPIIRAIVIVVGLLVAAVIWAYNEWDWFRAAVDGAMDAIGTAVSWVWENILEPVFSTLGEMLSTAADLSMMLWEQGIKPAFQWIGDAASWLYDVLITAFLVVAILVFQELGRVTTWLWEEVIDPIFGWIGDKARWVSEKAIGPAFREVKRVMDVVSDAANQLWDEAIKPVFNWIGDKAEWLWEEALEPPFKLIKTAIGLVADSFGKAKDDIDDHWNQVVEIAKKPVRIVISEVYNKAIVPLWNKVAGITGAAKLRPMDIKGFHTGGVMSGYSPGRDDRIIAVGGGEAIMRPEWTRAVGADRIHEWNAAARSGGVGGVRRAIESGLPAFADGGIVGWLKDKGNAVGEFFTGAADLVDPTKVFNRARDFVREQMRTVADNPWAKEVAKLPAEMLTGLKNKALDLVGFGGGDGSAAWLKPVNAAYGTPFGKRGSMWASGRHTGLDFPAATGTAIQAVDSGRVSLTRSGGPYGIHATINHGGGLTSLYAHMSSLMAKLGDTVTRGQQIGRVGSTGNSSGPHLHLEARLRGTTVDPMRYLGGTGRGFGARATGAAQEYAKSMLESYGWGSSQFGPLKKLWEGESNWRWNATNPTSGAYGIPQSLPASKMATEGADWRTNPHTQIRWGLQYIKDRPDYGSPAAAYSKWLSRSPHWYDDGGYLPPGLSLVANGTGRPEPVFTSGQWDDIRAARSGSTELHADVKVYVGDREITDIVRTEIVAREESTASAIDSGRWI